MKKILKKIISQDLLITIICFQFLVFYGTADFTKITEAPPNIWDRIWYVTEAFMYALFASYFALMQKEKNYVVAWVTLAIFLTIRAIWEIYAVQKGWDINTKIALAVGFYITSGICFFIILLPYLRKTWQRLQRRGK